MDKNIPRQSYVIETQRRNHEFLNDLEETGDLQIFLYSQERLNEESSLFWWLATASAEGVRQIRENRFRISSADAGRYTDRDGNWFIVKEDGEITSTEDHYE